MQHVDIDPEVLARFEKLDIDPCSLASSLIYRFKPIHLYKQQVELINNFAKNQKTISVLPRGAGKSFALAYYALYKFLMCPGRKIGIFSRSQRQANRLLEIISDIYKATPLLKISQANFSVSQVTRLKAHTFAEIVTLPHEPSTVLGEHPDILLLDECSSYPDDAIYKKVLKPMLTGVQTFDYKPELHLVSVLDKDRGFFYDIWTKHAEEFGFKKFERKWQECEGYDPREIERDRREMGEAYYQSQYCNNPLSNPSTPFPSSLINRSLHRVIFEPSYQTYGGLDIAKMRDNQALVIVQKCEQEKLRVIDCFIGKYDFSELANICKQYNEKYKLLSILVDTTHGEEFVDFGKRAPYVLPLKPFSFSGGHKANLIDFLHLQFEKQKILIDDFSPNLNILELISDLRSYSKFSKLPDTVAALALAVWNANKLPEPKEERWQPITF